MTLVSDIKEKKYSKTGKQIKEMLTKKAASQLQEMKKKVGKRIGEDDNDNEKDIDNEAETDQIDDPDDDKKDCDEEVEEGQPSGKKALAYSKQIKSAGKNKDKLMAIGAKVLDDKKLSDQERDELDAEINRLI